MTVEQIGKLNDDLDPHQYTGGALVLQVPNHQEFSSALPCVYGEMKVGMHSL